MGKSEKSKSTQSLAQSQVAADLMNTSGNLKQLREHQDKMDEILETADREMNMGRQELNDIDQFEKTLQNAREDNQKKMTETHQKLTQIKAKHQQKHQQTHKQKVHHKPQ